MIWPSWSSNLRDIDFHPLCDRFTFYSSFKLPESIHFAKQQSDRANTKISFNLSVFVTEETHWATILQLAFLNHYGTPQGNFIEDNWLKLLKKAYGFALLCFLLWFITVWQQLLFVHLKGKSHHRIVVALRYKLLRSETKGLFKGPFHIHF